MKVLAKDLKHGQRFRVEGNEYMASGSTDQNGACVCLDRLNRLAWIDGDTAVELIDPPEATAD